MAISCCCVQVSCVAADSGVRYRISADLLARTFVGFRECGRGRCECQMLWTSSWADPAVIREVVHPRHRAHAGGFEVDSAWLNAFWLRLAAREDGIRLQVHTHPGAAFHSLIDDRFPIIHSTKFLSLVIPSFALGAVGFEDAYLTEIQPDGSWCEVSIPEYLEVVP
jgi:hypothetical protein